MNFKTACEILEIDNKEEISKDSLKRHYRIKALKYHPDKNKQDNAAAMFQNIHSAYEYLSNHLDYADTDSDYEDNEECSQNEEKGNYNSILFSFLKNIIGRDASQSIYQIILNKISNTCENKAIQILKKLDKAVLVKICEMINKYKDAFHFSPYFFDKLEEIAKEKIKNDECIILNPEIDDLFENNLYKLTIGDHTYAVPLWHHELIYDNSGRDIYVKCSPVLPDNVMIDNKNNVIVKVNYNILDIWNSEYVETKIGTHNFRFSVEKLKIVKRQQIVLEKEGISKINTVNIYDVSKRGDIVIEISIT
jgi:DnaJ-class molecular chaperone